jgi:D-glycero-beta-D-manno-heptose-7-phosphate kinase
MDVYKGLSNKKLEEIIHNIKSISVLLIGDLCLDVYWIADMTKSELSRETPHFPLPVISERMSPGGGGNVAANIATLKPLNIKVLGAVGNDWRGEMLLRKLNESGIDTEGVVVSDKITTNAYCKPIRKGISSVEYEDPRIDFSNYEPFPTELEEKLLSQLENAAATADVVCVSDQFDFGCITPAIREKINTLGSKGKLIIVDSRNSINKYKNVILKPNEIEGFKAAYNKDLPKNILFDEFINSAKLLANNNQSNVCMTLGKNGCVYTDSKSVMHVPAYDVSPPIDFCGAGDTFLSAFSCALATNVKPWEAASFANLAAEVAIKKLGMTGTANADEIKDRHSEIFLNDRKELSL